MTTMVKKGMIRAMKAMSMPMARAMVVAGIPVTVDIMIVGTPTGPKGTGGVLATRQMTAAGRGGNPSPISMAAATATGAPCPATPSMKAEKEKAMSRAWMRRSGESEEMELLMTSNCPDSTVRLNRKTAVRMIQPMGNRPVTMPRAEAESAAVMGIRYTTTLMRMVRASVSSPATWPFMRFTARAQKRKKMGMATTRAVSSRLPFSAE